MLNSKVIKVNGYEMDWRQSISSRTQNFRFSFPTATNPPCCSRIPYSVSTGGLPWG